MFACVIVLDCFLGLLVQLFQFSHSVGVVISNITAILCGIFQNSTDVLDNLFKYSLLDALVIILHYILENNISTIGLCCNNLEFTAVCMCRN